MDSRVKELWCSALESNEYEQCEGRLKKDNRYCCLGVLTELYTKEHPDDHETKLNLATGTSLNKEVSSWSGIESFAADFSKMVNGKPTNFSLMQENDWGTSFRDIAVLIRKHF